MGATDEDRAAIGAEAMRKVFWRIIPLIMVAYLFAYLDRVNVSFAATDMNADLGFSATVYGLGSGMFYLGYALFEIPSNLMLTRFGARRWLARIMVTWGLLAAAMMLVQTPAQFYICRFLLGVAEAGFYPGVIYYFSSWFPPCHRSRAVSRFCIAVPMGSVVMGAVSGWLLGLDGTAGLAGWQWLFVAQGLPTVLVGIAVLLFLPDHMDEARWLSDPEKNWIAEELAREQTLFGKPPSHNPLAVLGNPRVLMFGAIGFLAIGANITFTLSVPMIMAETAGIRQASIGWMVSLGGVMGLLAMLWLGQQADRNGKRLQLALCCMAIIAVAYLMICFSPSWVVVTVAFFAFSAASPSIPMLTSSAWPDELSVHELAVGGAAINTIVQIGSFVMPFAWGALADATGSFDAGLIGLAVMAAASALLLKALGAQLQERHQERVRGLYQG